MTKDDVLFDLKIITPRKRRLAYRILTCTEPSSDDVSFITASRSSEIKYLRTLLYGKSPFGGSIYVRDSAPDGEWVETRRDVIREHLGGDFWFIPMKFHRICLEGHPGLRNLEELFLEED